MKVSKLSLKLSAAMTAGMLIGGTGDASAQMAGGTNAGAINFKAVETNMSNSTSTLPNLITTVAYIGGIGLGVAGILKLKAHVDAPAQVPLKDGLVRLGAGGGLLALPMVLDAMSGTIGNSANAPAISKTTAITY